MSLVTMKELLEQAKEKKIAVGAFNVGNMEMLLGVLSAAKLLNTPIIIQIAEARLSHSPLYLMGPMMVEAAKKTSVPVAVHFDHGKTKENIKAALNYGFTSVMYDGSSLDIEENIKNTKEIAALAKAYGATLEAELGTLGGSEGGTCDDKAICTKPSDAEYFVKNTPVDALAIAIGNAHGNYKKAPKLEFDILKEIDSRVEIPLVLHGGTGITPSDFQKCIAGGIRKINIATANFDACTNGALRLIGTDKPLTYFSLNEGMVEAVKENVMKHIKIFNMEAL